MMDNVLFILLDGYDKDHTKYMVGYGDTVYKYVEYDWEELPSDEAEKVKNNSLTYVSHFVFSESQFGCAMQESSSAKDFYDILLASFLKVNFYDYPFKRLIKSDGNRFFTRYSNK